MRRLPPRINSKNTVSHYVITSLLTHGLSHAFRMAALVILRRGIRKTPVDEDKDPMFHVLEYPACVKEPTGEQELIISKHFTGYSIRIQVRTSDSPPSFASALFSVEKVYFVRYCMTFRLTLPNPRNCRTYVSSFVCASTLQLWQGCSFRHGISYTVLSY